MYNISMTYISAFVSSVSWETILSSNTLAQWRKKLYNVSSFLSLFFCFFLVHGRTLSPLSPGTPLSPFNPLLPYTHKHTYTLHEHRSYLDKSDHFKNKQTNSYWLTYRQSSQSWSSSWSSVSEKS